MITREKLTGRVRARPRFFSKKLILQVEVRRETIRNADLIPCAAPPGRDPAAWEERSVAKIEAGWRPMLTFWRDATWEDLQPNTEAQRAAAGGPTGAQS